MSRADNPCTFSRPEHNLHFTENKIRLKCVHLSYFNEWKIIKTLRMKYPICQLNWQSTVISLFAFFSVRRKLCSGLEKAHALSALLMLFFARFEFDSAIYRNFSSFRVLFIYWLRSVVISRLEGVLTLFLLILAFMELFTFLWKTCLVEKVFF